MRWNLVLISFIFVFNLLDPSHVLCINSDVVRKGGLSSVFSLFNLRQKSRFWSESILYKDIDDLDPSSKVGMGALNYTKAGNIANYLAIQEVESLFLPVPVNFIFVGFDGNGNEAFNLKSEDLERWFINIDHVYEHTRVPNLYMERGPEQVHHLPAISHINYNFSANAIQLGGEVSSLFELAITVLARKDIIVNGSDGLWQVDLDMIDVMFNSLIDYFHLENAYNLFILNPKRNKDRPKYGYRRGLSAKEIDFLTQNATLRNVILNSGKSIENLFVQSKSIKPLYERHPMAKFSWTVMEETDSVEWCSFWREALHKVEMLYEGKDYSEVLQHKVLQILNGNSEDIKIQLRNALKSGNLDSLHEECLTDTWVGSNRWAFVDLTAGPFTWGPAVGGEGVRIELSLPNVIKTIGVVAEISEDEAENRLQEAIQEKFAVFGDKDHQAIDILLAEIDIYEMFAFKHCKGRRNKLVLCGELDERMRDLKNELQTFDHGEYDDDHKKKAVEALNRMESWNLFKTPHEGGHNYTVARDSFLAHLGSLFWGSMRHIMAPSLADGSFHYYQKISYQLIFITQEKLKNIKQLPIDLNVIKQGLSSLLLSSQTPMFSTSMLSLSEDHALAMAFAVSRRAAAIPSLLVDGTYKKATRSYLDSSTLQFQLQRLSDLSLKGSHVNGRSTLEIPIFWFFHDDPLFVDKHYLAKAMSDMVIVVQSNFSSWESHLQCNGQSIFWDLSLPLKHAVAAVSEHVAGLLPIHIAYSHALESPIEDWIWSVGCNPLSVTSQGWKLPLFQSDTIARSYVLTGLEESILLVNAAVHRLILESTTEKTYKVFQSYEGYLINSYLNVVRLWKRVSTVVSELKLVEALQLLNSLEDASQRFSSHVNETIAQLHPIQCTRDRSVHVVFDMTTVPAFLVVIAVFYFVLKPKPTKPKIN